VLVVTTCFQTFGTSGSGGGDISSDEEGEDVSKVKELLPGSLVDFEDEGDEPVMQPSVAFCNQLDREEEEDDEDRMACGSLRRGGDPVEDRPPWDTEVKVGSVFLPTQTAGFHWPSLTSLLHKRCAQVRPLQKAVACALACHFSPLLAGTNNARASTSSVYPGMGYVQVGSSVRWRLTYTWRCRCFRTTNGRGAVPTSQIAVQWLLPLPMESTSWWESPRLHSQLMP
jgi:hypothetical protein